MKAKVIAAASLLALSFSAKAQINQNTSGQTGFGTASPGNRVEITSGSVDPYFTVLTTNGSSGLKLTNLPNTKTPLTGNGKVLSTDNAGNVILVTDQTATSGSGLTGAQNGCSIFSGNTVEFGNTWGGTSANLLSNREVPQNNNLILFSGNNVNDRIKMGGTASSNGSNSRLYIENHLPSGQTYANFPGLHITSDAEANENIGALLQLQDKSTSVFAPVNKGVHIATAGSGAQYGAFINATSNANSTAPRCYGIYLGATSQGAQTIADGLDVTASSNGAAMAVGVSAVAAGAGPTGANYGGIFTAQGNNQNPTAMNYGLAANAENIEANGTGIYTSVGPSNAPIQANSTHIGVDVKVSTGNNTSSIQDLTQYGVKTDIRNLGITAGNSASGKLYAVYAKAWNESKPSNGFLNYGVYATAETSQLINGASGTESNIAVYATTRQLNYGPQSVGLNSWAGWFDGDVFIGGSGGSGGGQADVLVINGSGLSTQPMWNTSDRNYKTNIKKLEGVAEKIKSLNGYTYNFKTEEFPDKNFSKKEQIGFIAQELKEVFPQVVREGKDGYLAVNYQGMIPVLLQAVKEQQSQIEQQDEKIAKQQQQIDELKALVQTVTGNAAAGRAAGNGNGTTTGQSVSLSDKNVLVLDQNVPNPFAESTVITYNIPSDFSKAQIVFTTNDGKIIKSVDITEKGAGTLNVFANDLSHGLYTYTLIIDGKTIDTKKMIKE